MGIGDARELWTFKTKAQTYEFIVSQLMRSVRRALHRNAVGQVIGAQSSVFGPLTPDRRRYRSRVFSWPVRRKMI